MRSSALENLATPNPTPTDEELAELVALDRAIRIDLAKDYAKRKDVLRWGACLFPEKFNLPFCALHDYIVAIRGLERTELEAPRNHAKTTLQCFVVLIFQALEEPADFDHYLNVQATKEKALSINISIRTEIEVNEELREIYGDQIGEKWTDRQFVLKNGVIFTAVGAGESIRGLNYRNKRPNYIVVDDLYDEDDTHNVESTNKKTAWFWGSLYPARAKSRRCAIHVQGTAINPWSILERLKKLKRWVSKTFKAIVDDAKKIALWPELYSWEELDQERRDMPIAIFNREMQNELGDEKESKVKRSWLDKWEYDPQWLRREIQDGRLQLAAVVIGNDPSIGKNTESDDTGTSVVFKTIVPETSRVDYWVDFLAAEKLSLEERKNQLEQLAKDRMPGEEITMVKIEAIGGFDDYASYVVSTTSLPVERVEHVKDKLSNLESKSHHFQNGRVHINRDIGATSDGRDLKEMALHQLTTNYPQHDDVRDAILLPLEPHSAVWNWI